MFSHEKLDVHRCALEFSAEIFEILNKLPRGTREVQDQLKRASISVLSNIAEGAGKTMPDDKKRFYSIARGSTFECAAILDLLQVWELKEESVLISAKQRLHRMASMLSKLIVA